MSTKRIESYEEGLESKDQTPIYSALLMARKNELHPTPTKAEKSDEEKIHIFWRIFGGTILSIATLIAITLYNQFSSNINELRNEIARINEARAELVKKDEFNTRIATNYDRIMNLQTSISNQLTSVTSLRTEMDGIKDRTNKNASDLEALKKDLVSLETTKERLSLALGELKTLREEASKIRQDVDKNVSADQERKARRDDQYRDLEKSLRDLNTLVNDCQVKVARLEGSQTAPTKASVKANLIETGTKASETPTSSPKAPEAPQQAIKESPEKN